MWCWKYNSDRHKIGNWITHYSVYPSQLVKPFFILDSDSIGMIDHGNTISYLHFCITYTYDSYHMSHMMWGHVKNSSFKRILSKFIVNPIWRKPYTEIGQNTFEGRIFHVTSHHMSHIVWLICRRLVKLTLLNL